MPSPSARRRPPSWLAKARALWPGFAAHDEPSLTEGLDEFHDDMEPSDQRFAVGHLVYLGLEGLHTVVRELRALREAIEDLASSLEPEDEDPDAEQEDGGEEDGGEEDDAEEPEADDREGSVEVEEAVTDTPAAPPEPAGTAARVTTRRASTRRAAPPPTGPVEVLDSDGQVLARAEGEAVP
ncbi:hypothetical protein L6R50_08900 [Myxococcota bacterium]|nr:hypothetical protein [Myxococcota bacterium]